MLLVRLGQYLAGHERATGNQLVVVTLPDLQGYDIATFSNLLARQWGVGQKGKNNGVLLVVAKKERKMRIEVGYGLEGQLTDAISANIIHGVMTPAFKRALFIPSPLRLCERHAVVTYGRRAPLQHRPQTPSHNPPHGLEGAAAETAAVTRL